MAAGHTTDTRTHVMGDMLMMTGTFTDGGTDVSFDGTLSTVFAAGGHVTSLYNTGVVADGEKTAGATTFTVKTVDARLHFNVGESVYASNDGDPATVFRVGVVSAILNATAVVVDSVIATVSDEAAIYKLGPNTGAVTLTDGNLSVAIDETNKYVVFGNGNLGAASTAHTQDGRWWILGLR